MNLRQRRLSAVGLAVTLVVGLGAATSALAADDGLDASVSAPYLFPALLAAGQPAAQQSASGAQVAQASPSTEPNVAQAQIQRGQTVRGRPRPDYDPQGLPLGSFTLFPELVIAPLFDDNIFRVDSGTDSDVVTVFSPTLNLESNWSRHALNLEAGASIGKYFDFDDENFEDYRFNADGRVDVTRNTLLGLSGGVAHLHQGRGDPDDPAGALEPTTYDRYSAAGRASHRMGRFTGTLRGGVRRFDYQDVARTGGGPDINNDDRDNDRFDASAQVSYEIVPDYDAFVRFGGNVTDYDDALDDTGVNRDNHGYDAVAGMEVDFGGIVFGNFFAGYTWTMREDDALEDFSGFNVGADITWNVTRLTTITGTVAREVRDTTLGGASGSFATTVGLQVDHELLRNLIISANASGQQNDYEGIDRTDYNIVGGLAVDYFINRYFFVGALYEHRERLSGGDVQGIDFSDNIAGLRAGAQF